MSREAMKLALHTLEGWANYGKWVWPESAVEQAKRNTTESIAALRQALETEQEPVAFRNKETGEFCTGGFMRKEWSRWTPLYTSPPKRQWVGLTEEALEMPMDIQVIEIIFKKMKLTYGKDFIDQHKDEQMQEVMQNWAKELAGFRPHEIAYGLERLPDKLPDVRQFRDVCRMAPPVWW